MAYIIVSIVLVGYLLIATERLTNMNKAAVAIFIGTVGWVLYICYGTDFVMSQHPREYFNFLHGTTASSVAVKQFIAQNVFLKYVGKASEIVLFLLATMSIVEILQNNGCFDFALRFMRTRSSRRMLWSLAIVTFAISANLDNLTTTVMMLTMMRQLVSNHRTRLVYGSAIVLAANCGGVLTVIGDPVGLVLWNNGAVTATNYSMSLLLPCLVAWVLPTWWIGRSLPETVSVERVVLPYRGDDTNLNVWQRVMMLVVGIGGLWFIPTFHNITKLSPFLGALCVLSVLWIVNEVVNRRLITDEMIHRRVPRVLQYGVLQMMLFVMGSMLALGVVRETGMLDRLLSVFHELIGGVWTVGALTGLLSTVLDSFLSALTIISVPDVVDGIASQTVTGGFDAALVQNGAYWKIVAFAAAVGGNILCIGSASGLAFVKMERVRVGWYFRNVGWKCLVGALCGLAVLWAVL